MFQLSKEEFDELKKNLIFQFGISIWGGTRKLPHAFTEQGVAMLSGILNSRNVSRSSELITSVRIRSTVLKWKAFATS